MPVWGLGAAKNKTKLGEFLNRKGITQGELTKASGVNKNTLTLACSDPNYEPSDLTKRRIINALTLMEFGVSQSDFW